MTETVFVPRINVNDDKVQVVEWLVADGDPVETGDEIVVLETSKASVTVTADHTGFIRSCALQGRVVRVGEPLYLVAASAQDLSEIPAESPSNDAGSPEPGEVREGKPADSLAQIPNGTMGPTRFSPAALRLMQQQGLSPEQFVNAGLVTAGMIAQMLRPDRPAPAGTAAVDFAAAFDQAPIPQAARSEPLSLGKLAEIEALSRGESGNINSTLHVYFASQTIRDRLRAEGAFDGGLLPLILFETSRLLKQWPQLTACCAQGEVHYYDRVDIGLAVDLGRGLKVATIAGADRLMPVEFHEAMLDIGSRYLENGLRPEDLSGSTFTVTDLSELDVLHFHPLINGAQSAILGVGGDSRMAGHPMTLNLTFDHRVTNGREAGEFLNMLRDRLLSYAPSQLDLLGAEMAPGVLGSPEQIACDVCGIALPDYMRDFRRDACMTPYFREDGTLGAICHVCKGGL